MKDKTEEHKIQTPIGIFNDINKAIKTYPSLIEAKRVKKCPECETYFIDRSRMNNRKYCSEPCSNEAIRIYKNIYNSAWNRDKWLRTKNTTIIQDKQHTKTNYEYHQNDNFWGLGESNLREHPNKDEDKEHELITKELQRINRRWNNETLPDYIVV